MLAVRVCRLSQSGRTRIPALSPCVAVLAVATAAAPTARAASILNEGGGAVTSDPAPHTRPVPDAAVTSGAARAATTQAVDRTADAIEPGLGLEVPDPLAALPGEDDAGASWLRPPRAAGDSAIMEQLVEHIRRTYEQYLSPHALDEATLSTVPADRRRHPAAALTMPPEDPDAYRYRPIADIQPSDDQNTMTRGGAEASLSLSVRDGQRVYTYRDTAGNVIHEGPLETSEDRRNVPIEVWKLLYEMENTKTEPPPHANAR